MISFCDRIAGIYRIQRIHLASVRIQAYMEKEATTTFPEIPIFSLIIKEMEKSVVEDGWSIVDAIDLGPVSHIGAFAFGKYRNNLENDILAAEQRNIAEIKAATEKFQTSNMPEREVAIVQ